MKCVYIKSILLREGRMALTKKQRYQKEEKQTKREGRHVKALARIEYRKVQKRNKK
jgi:hypothetical protein